MLILSVFPWLDFSNVMQVLPVRKLLLFSWFLMVMLFKIA